MAQTDQPTQTEAVTPTAFVANVPVITPEPAGQVAPAPTPAAYGPNTPPAQATAEAPAAPIPLPPLAVMYSHVGLRGSRMVAEMDGLRVVRQEATQNNIARQVALNAALMLFVRGPAIGISGFSKDDFKGVEPEDAVDKNRLTNPGITHLPAETQRRATQWLAEHKPANQMAFKQPLVINSAAWRLIYNSLDAADTTFRLKFEAEIYKIRENPSFITGDRRGGKACTYTSEARQLDDWKANDYQAVVDLVPQVAAKCADEFVGQMAQLLELE